MVRREARRETPNEEKFKELILYIITKTEGDPSFGAIRLNKALFFADLFAYGQLGRSITGQEYQKLEMGPAPRRLVPVRDEMIESEDVVTAKRAFKGYTQHRLVAMREPNLSEFSGAEIALVDELLSLMKGKTGKEVSDMSHGFLDCWDGVPLHETIPLSVVFVTNRDLTERERAHARDLEVTLVG